MDHLVNALADCERPDQVLAILDKHIPVDDQSEEDMQGISSLIASSGLGNWLIEESHIWFAEQLFLKDSLEAASRELMAIRIQDTDQASSLLKRIESLLGELVEEPAIAAHCARLALKSDDYQDALAKAALLPEGDENRITLLKDH